MVKNKTQLIINHAISLTRTGKYELFENLKTSFWLMNGGRHYPSMSRKSDVYFFDDFIIVIRKQQFLFFCWLQKFIVSNRPLGVTLGTTIDNYTTSKFIYWTQRRMEVQIQLVDMKYKHISAVLTLSELSDEQIEKIKSFEERIRAVDDLLNNR
jgi:hypothetical protein